MYTSKLIYHNPKLFALQSVFDTMQGKPIFLKVSREKIQYETRIRKIKEDSLTPEIFKILLGKDTRV
jgi:hypothetical protein